MLKNIPKKIPNKKIEALITKAHNDFERGLKTHAFFRTNDSLVSDDLVQETFTKTWKYLLREGKVSLMKPFLYHILNCLIIDEYRKHKSVSLDVLLEQGFEPSSFDSNRILDFHDAQLAANLIEKLPLTYRKIIYMRYIQELTIPEISKLMGKSKNTIAVQSHRGLEKLKILYKNQYPELD